MILTEKDLKIASDFFNNNPEYLLEPLASEMNTTHKNIPAIMIALEESGIDGYDIDELMLSIITIWYAIVKVKKIRIKRITKSNIIKNIEKWNEFLNYFNKSDDSERRELQFINREKELNIFATTVLKNIYMSPSMIPEEVATVYYGIVKSFEDKLYESNGEFS
ncbi:MAG: hypothetical protein H7A25_26120 [Leptospiraceae bacterium]|nr:hypothetical protein [Leptospiraceae bacterium]